jgi:ATP-binding cassette subfamily F protein 3
LLLAAALIQNPDLLLLDEPTNNLDSAGISHLTKFLTNYSKSVVVISHDAEFLNAFTQGVLYLDSFTQKVEQYAGNYLDVVAEIATRIEKENRLNAQKARGIQENKDKANFFAHKGGKMRNVAKKMREKIEQFESEKVEVRREDKTIRQFVIPVQVNIPNDTLKITSFEIMQNHQKVTKPANIILMKRRHLRIVGPNGIGKSTLIESMAKGNQPGLVIPPQLRVGYYRQDFSTLDFNQTVYQSLSEAMSEAGESMSEEKLRSVASGFLLTAEVVKSKIGNLSEGQKGLVAFARLVLLKPGLLILDEPTNHINFRHLPIIAAALDSYEGAMILVSHLPEFVAQIRIDDVLDLEK